VLRPGGWLCASMRADNLQNRVIDRMSDRGTKESDARQFHKANYSRREFKCLLETAGFKVDSFEHVANMSFLYKFALLRHRTHRRFDEHIARKEGYRFSSLGSFLQGGLMTIFPASFCNINVAIAQKI
jgi:hypothetical protein